LRRKPGGGAANGLKRLFTKNTGLCEAVRRSIGADSCPVLDGEGELSQGGEPKPQ